MFLLSFNEMEWMNNENISLINLSQRRKFIDYYLFEEYLEIRYCTAKYAYTVQRDKVNFHFSY